jgi:very-short-patch-repair endonuclease
MPSDIARRQMRPVEVTMAIAAFAAPRHGVVSLGELTDLGLGERGVQHRAAAGHLHRLHDGVYAVGHRGVGVDGRRRAAVLACGEGAALSHRSAAALWGMCPDDPLAWHVTARWQARGRAQPRGVVRHWSRVLSPEDVVAVRHVWVTTVAWTLVDLAAVVSRAELERAIQEAEVLGILDVAAVLAVLDRCRGRRGTGVLRRLLEPAANGITRSELEARFARLCRRAALPLPVFNVRIEGFEVDALWPDERVIVELDGARFHRTRRGFEADRRRDSALAAAGYVVIRVTWRRLHEEPRTLTDELRRLIRLRGGHV